MGNGPDGNNPNGSNVNVVSDESALLSGLKIERKGADGTTIVFYSFLTAPQSLKLSESDIDSKDLLKKIEQAKYNSFLYSSVEGGYIYPPSEMIKECALDSMRQMEGIADIKFFDLNNLSAADKKYLSENGVKIPTTPDFDVSSALLKNEDGKITTGISGFPRQGDSDPVRHMILNISIENEVNQILALGGDKEYSAGIISEIQEKIRSTVMHELGHGVGLKHSHYDDKPDTPHLNEYMDNSANTVMSYNDYDNCGETFTPKTYQEYDVKALQELYGVSKNPTPGLQESLEKEESEQWKNASEDMFVRLTKDKAQAKLEGFKDVLTQSVNELTADKELSSQDIDLLKTQTKDLIEKTFNGDELLLLAERISVLSTISILGDKDSAKIDLGFETIAEDIKIKDIATGPVNRRIINLSKDKSSSPSKG